MAGLEFQNLEMRDSIRQCFKRWSKVIPCSNILWITRETLERLAVTDATAWRWTIDAEQGVEAMKPVSLARLFSDWKLISRVSQFKSLRRPQNVSHEDGRSLLVPLLGRQSGEVIGYFLFEDVKLKAGSKRLQTIKTELKQSAQHIEFCWQYMHAKAQSYVDDLTSLFNQRYLPMVFEREISRMERMKKKFSVLFLDIDYFKRVNDTRGHWTGSKLLIEVANLLKKSTRSCDYAFRYGGDEFVVVLVDTSPENGHKVAERIRKTIEQHEFSVDGAAMKLTVSIGLAIYPDHAKSTVELIQLADQAMYYGKHKSRNVVFSAS